MKIKFIAPWNTDYNIYCFINDIWNMEGVYDDVLTYKDDYTHLVIYNGGVNQNNYRIDKNKTYAIVEAPYWSNGSDRNILSYCKKVITYEPDKYELGRTIFSPLLGTHRLYDRGTDGEIIPALGTTKRVLSTTFEKTKTLSIIVANHGLDTRTSTNYNNRQNLVLKLMNSDLDFDMYGLGWYVNDGYGWHITDSRYKGPLVNKIDGISKYKYTITLENSPVRGEVSEKFIDAILCNTIPIYNGHKDIQEFYPNSYEYMEYDGHEIERIKQIINSQNTAADYDFEGAKNRYLNVYNPIKIVIDDIIKGD